MKRLCVFGANGQTGVEVLKQCLQQQVPVRAAVRDAQSVAEYADQVDVVEYSFDDPASVVSALKDCDVAMSVIGSGGQAQAAKETTLYSRSIRTLINALRKTNKDRLLVISSAGVEYDSQAPWYYRYFFRPFLMNSYMDMMKVETVLEETDEALRWTIVRPTYLLDGKAKPYRVNNRKMGGGNFKIHRIDVADFMVKESQRDEWVRQYPVLGYP